VSKVTTSKLTAKRGFTLLEVVLAITLLVMLLAMMFLFHSTSLDTARQGVHRTRDALLGRVILQQICDEIRQANGYLAGYQAGIIGTRDEIQIYGVTVPDKDLFEKRSITEDQLPGQDDVRMIRYTLAWSEDQETDEGDPICYGLVRRDQRTLNQLMIVEDEVETEEDQTGAEEIATDVRLELYAPEIKYLRFAYLDGADWVSTWQPLGQKGNSLPQAIRVTVGYTPVVLKEDEAGVDVKDQEEELEEDYVPPSDSFTMIVRLPMATEAVFGSRAVGLSSSLGGSLGGF